MTSYPHPQAIVQFDDCDLPADVIDALGLGHFVTGEHRWARTRRLARVREEATLLPPDAEPTRVAVDENRRTCLAEGDGWMLWATRWSDRSANVTVTAVDEATGRAVLDLAVEGATEPAPPDDGPVPVGFWHLGPHGPLRHERHIAVDDWGAIRRNYTRRAALALDALMAVTGEQINGRLLLLHGPPGTGKTTALRALARSWRPWCQVDTVLDPENLFANSSYLLAPALCGPDEDGGNTHKWRLLVLEDCDELIRADAKQGTGQALARLLNLTDGLLGQGVNLLIAITTDEPVGRLHPALVRPGRCLAQLDVGPLTPAEAAAWLGRPVPRAAGDGFTLAELYARRDRLEVIESAPAATGTGHYL